MDSRAPTRSSIWQKRCPTGEGKTCWFSKNRSFYRKEESETPRIHSKNRVCKPPSLLRLSSTGDRVDDISDFSGFDPANLRGIESNFQDRAKPKSGVLDRIAKFAFSANNSDFQQSTARGFVRESSETMAKQVDLSILMEKFDGHLGKMEGPGHFMSGSVPPVAHPPQGGGGMRGFVKEGIYHPFAKNSPNQVGTATQSHPVNTAEMQQPAVHAFPLFNLSSFSNPHHRPHPYTHTRFVPERRTNFAQAPTQFWHGLQAPGMTPVTSYARRHASQSHVSRPHGCTTSSHCCQIRDSAMLRNWIVDPRIRSQFINTESIAARLQPQGHNVTNLQSQHRVAHHACSNNSMMKTRTEMTQQNLKPNETTGCVHTGNAHQAGRLPLSAEGKTWKQSMCSPRQSPKHQSTSMCPSSQDKPQNHDNERQKTSNQHAPENDKVVRLEETDKHLESVTDEVKLLKTQNENEEKDTISESHDIRYNTDRDRSMHCPARVTSSVDRETDPCATAGKAAQNTTGPKSANDESSRDKYGGSADAEYPLPNNQTSQGKSHLSCSQEKTVAVDTEQIGKLHIQESHTFTLEDDCASKSTQGESYENADCGLPLSSTSSLSPREQVRTCSLSPAKLETNISQNPKPLHSTLAFLLAETPDGDSDFSDSDWESTGSPPSSDSWDFLKCWDDPYNPLCGWRCANRSERQDQKLETESKLDDELDSGISSLQAQQDDTADVSPVESESWDEDEPSVDDPKHSVKSLCPSNDSVNLLNTVVCSAIVNSPEASIQDPCSSTDLTVTVQSQVQDDPPATPSIHPTEVSHSSLREEAKTPAQLAIVSEPQKLHPSVLFILGADDSDSESDCEDDDDFDNCDTDSFDAIWSSPQAQQCPDPYSPLQGWRFCLTIPVTKAYHSLPTLNEDTTAELSNSVVVDNENSRSTQRPFQFVAEADPRPNLKRASTTGCLWIPCVGSAPGRPLHNKKVHFCEDSPEVINFESPSWSSEYSDSRRGPWQEMARDRCRFRDRIRCVEEQIVHIFAPEHRRSVLRRMQAPIVQQFCGKNVAT